MESNSLEQSFQKYLESLPPLKDCVSTREETDLNSSEGEGEILSRVENSPLKLAGLL